MPRDLDQKETIGVLPADNSWIEDVRDNDDQRHVPLVGNSEAKEPDFVQDLGLCLRCP